MKYRHSFQRKVIESKSIVVASEQEERRRIEREQKQNRSFAEMRNRSDNDKDDSRLKEAGGENRLRGEGAAGRAESRLFVK